MDSYYWWVLHEHEHFLFLSNASAWAVITYDFSINISIYYSWVTHKYGSYYI